MSVLKLLVPDAYEKNAVVMHKSKTGCCGSTANICKYSLSIGGNYTQYNQLVIEENGEEITLALTVLNNTDKGVKTAIVNALKEAGYDPFYSDNWKGVIVNNGNITIIGDVIVKALKTNSSTSNAHKSCDVGKLCKFALLNDFETDPGKISINGSSEEQIHDTDGFESTMTEAQVQTAYENAIDATGYTDYYKVEVTKDNVNETFIVVVHLHGTLIINGNTIDFIGCYSDFL